MFELILFLAIAGGLGYAGWKHYGKTSTDGGKPGEGGPGGATTGGTQFGDLACQAEYNKLTPQAKEQVDLAVREAKAVGGAAASAKITTAANILRPGSPAMAKCLDALAKTYTAVPGQTQAANDPTTYFSSKCISAYQAMTPEQQAIMQAEVAKALAAGGGATGAQVLTDDAGLFTHVDPSVYQCLLDAAASMSPGSKGGTGTEPSTTAGEPPMPKLPSEPEFYGDGSGSEFFADNESGCLDTYNAMDPSERARVDTLYNAAKAEGGAGGARILQAGALCWFSSQPQIQACIMSKAVAMNGGAPVELPSTFSCEAATGVKPSAAIVNPLMMNALNTVSVMGMPRRRRSSGIPRFVFGRK